MEGHGILRAQKSTNPGSGRKEMCSPADNLQTTDVIRGVVLLLFLLCFEAVDGLFLLLRETCEMPHATLSPGILGVRLFLGHLCCTIDVIFQISRTSSKFGQR